MKLFFRCIFQFEKDPCIFQRGHEKLIEFKLSPNSLKATLKCSSLFYITGMSRILEMTCSCHCKKTKILWIQTKHKLPPFFSWAAAASLYAQTRHVQVCQSSKACLWFYIRNYPILHIPKLHTTVKSCWTITQNFTSVFKFLPDPIT